MPFFIKKRYKTGRSADHSKNATVSARVIICTRAAHIDNMIQRYKRLTLGSLDPDNVRKYQERLEYWQNQKTELAEVETVDNDGENDIIKPLPIDIQLFAKKSSDFTTVILSKEEYAHVMSEINTWATKSQMSKKAFSKPIGNYVYTVENNGFGEYRIIGKELIE